MKLFFVIAFLGFKAFAQVDSSPQVLNTVQKDGVITPTNALALRTEFILKDFTWEELGLEDRSEFTDVVEKNWKAWLAKEWSLIAPEVIICPRTPCPGQGDYEVTLKVNIQRTLVSRVPLEYKALLYGGVVLQKKESKEVVAFADLPLEWKVIPFNDQKDFNSTLATILYRFPIAKFFEIKKKLPNISEGQKSSSISFLKIPHLEAALAVASEIEEKGKSLGLSLKLESFTREGAKFRAKYIGREKKFTDFVKSLSGLQWNQRRFSLKTIGDGYLLEYN